MKKYLITILAGLLAVFLILWAKDIFVQTETVVVFHILCDAFFAVGVVITGVGLLIFSTNEGTFDMLSYGMSVFADMFRRKPLRKYDTFYDYRVSRQDKKLHFGFMLICGLLFLAVSGVMYYLYRMHS
ncbi:MAG: DUF3899 domain-containing protein [Ruminococcaceae bacterium]|nr:DUF3899 domain-containing protein [Oscillospiraceae bacterium]